MIYHNPVIKGFYPDPSICRVGEDYYLVTSSFEFFPGVPLFHSKNLVNWKQIGHCLTRDSQLGLRGCHASAGVYAPTIRYHEVDGEGIFFMVTTNVGGGGHFIVHSRNLAQGWSEPVWVAHEGIDPSLFFEGGKAYFCCTGDDNGKPGIWLFEVDPFTGTRLSEPVCVSNGCMGKHAEAPHVYAIDGKYYLMLAEGGTEYGHMITMQRAGCIYGPYEPCPHNPILSHRNRMNCDIQAMGHGDLLEDANGNWWMVCLGIRTLPRVMLHNLGRETFLTPVRWENGWPIAGQNGWLNETMDGPLPAACVPENLDWEDDFKSDMLSDRWTFVRNPERERYRLAEGKLHIDGGEDVLSRPGASPAWVGVRQQAFQMTAKTSLARPLIKGQKAGLSVFYNDSYHYDVYLERREDGACAAALRRCVHGMEAALAPVVVEGEGEVGLRVVCGTQNYDFYCETAQGSIYLGAGAAAGLCTEGTRTMTFTGVFIGLFSTGGEAAFSGFSIRTEG